MRDIDCIFGSKDFIAAVGTPADFTNFKVYEFAYNPETGKHGDMGAFPDLYIKTFIKPKGATPSYDATSITVVLSGTDSLEGTPTWVDTDTIIFAGPFKPGQELKVKLPREHKRYLKVKLGCAVATGSTVSFSAESYLER